MIQFVHRWLGIFIVLLVGCLYYYSRKEILSLFQRRTMLILLLVTVFQMLLGISTLVFHVPLLLAVLHQFSALLLLTIVICQLFLVRDTAS